MWWLFALLSAFFAALTAIFAKIGSKGLGAVSQVALVDILSIALTVLFPGEPLTLKTVVGTPLIVGGTLVL
ncbi:hypothetical protein [Larkinella rosea]|uniref:EamA family transporter n=1 Tax=Larkinella rosea TaxID=2025312 RepID=A0A3P1BJV7_9BACT|nr:hypothetical protein [Larkinella rosea]RRB01143.1 hypothetical protein EHT25_23500 [Larkinella rosea]